LCLATFSCCHWFSLNKSLTAIASDTIYNTYLFQDLQKFLDDSEHGVIYFSLGSLVKTDTLAAEKRDAFLQAFAELPQRILWKWEADTIPNKPPNVKIARWLPQVDVLRTFQCRLSHMLQKFIKPLIATKFNYRNQSYLKQFKILHELRDLIRQFSPLSSYRTTWQ